MQEIVRCGRDPVYFTNNYAKISEPMRGLIYMISRKKRYTILPNTGLV